MLNENFVLDEIKLQKFDENERTSYDITSLVSAISITESLRSPSIYGEITIVDGVDLLNGTQLENVRDRLNLTGEEFITIRFHTEEPELNFEFKFVVGGVITEEKGLSADIATVTLRLLSPDTFINSIAAKSCGYSNLSITDTVKRILEQELKTEVPIVDFEQSTGLTTHGFTEIKPFEKINYLQQKAYVADDSIKSSTFMFYQDRRGYNFKSLQKIIKDNYSNNTVLTYIHSPLASRDRSDVTREIIRFEPTSRTNNNRRLYHGLYNTKVLYFDLRTKQLHELEARVFDDPQIVPRTDNETEYGLQASKLLHDKIKEKQLGSLTYFIPWDSSEGRNDYTPQTLAYTSPFVILLDENTINFRINGTLEFNIGDPIDLYILDNKPIDKDEPDEKRDRRYSGRHFVFSITHEIYVLSSVGSFGYSLSVTAARERPEFTQQFYDQQYQTQQINLSVLR